MRFYNILSNNAFWTVIGILLGSAINHVFWLFQLKRQEKLQNRSDRQKKMAEICEFFNSLDEKLKIVYGVCITGKAVDYFSEIKNFWSNVPTLKIRMNIQMFFGKCLNEYDALQITISKFIETMHKIMGNESVSKNEFDKKYSEIFIKRDDFINALIKEYSRVISI